MWKKVQSCLEKYGVMNGPLLLGYSGGVDSTALFFLLKKYNINVHVIHVNHGWRSTSLQEAHMLKRQVESFGLPFYLETIETIDPHQEGNLEDKYRQERLKIFQRYYQEIQAKALLLAHQKDDQAETVFKRIFEGASLGKLAGLKECAEIAGMTVLRPFLSITKEELYRFIHIEGVPFIEDETNQNTHYLRARQRVEIFPEIEKKFGKNATNNLYRLGHHLRQYEGYMERKIQRYQQEVVKGFFGIYLNLKNLYPIEQLELEYFIRKTCQQYGCSISCDGLDTLVTKIQEEVVNKKIVLQHLEIIIDRGYLFFVPPVNRNKATESLEINQLPCVFEYQGIKWKLEEVDVLRKPSSWQNCWQGEVEFSGSEGPFTIKPPNLSYHIGSKTLKDRYIEYKIPNFLRGILPHVVQKTTLCCDL